MQVVNFGIILNSTRLNGSDIFLEDHTLHSITMWV